MTLSPARRHPTRSASPSEWKMKRCPSQRCPFTGLGGGKHSGLKAVGTAGRLAVPESCIARLPTGPAEQDTMLVFQEDREHPVARLAMADLPSNTILSVIEQHQYLQLPRLSSQRVFDALCPEESSKTRKRLCVVLFTRDTEGHREYRQAMRDFVRANRFSSVAAGAGTLINRINGAGTPAVQAVIRQWLHKHRGRWREDAYRSF